MSLNLMSSTLSACSAQSLKEIDMDEPAPAWTAIRWMHAASPHRSTRYAAQPCRSCRTPIEPGDWYVQFVGTGVTAAGEDMFCRTCGTSAFADFDGWWEDLRPNGGEHLDQWPHGRAGASKTAKR